MHIEKEFKIISNVDELERIISSGKCGQVEIKKVSHLNLHLKMYDKTVKIRIYDRCENETKSRFSVIFKDQTKNGKKEKERYLSIEEFDLLLYMMFNLNTFELSNTRFYILDKWRHRITNNTIGPVTIDSCELSNKYIYDFLIPGQYEKYKNIVKLIKIFNDKNTKAEVPKYLEIESVEKDISIDDLKKFLNEVCEASNGEIKYDDLKISNKSISSLIRYYEKDELERDGKLKKKRRSIYKRFTMTTYEQVTNNYLRKGYKWINYSDDIIKEIEEKNCILIIHKSDRMIEWQRIEGEKVPIKEEFLLEMKKNIKKKKEVKKMMAKYKMPNLTKLQEQEEKHLKKGYKWISRPDNLIQDIKNKTKDVILVINRTDKTMELIKNNKINEPEKVKNNKKVVHSNNSTRINEEAKNLMIGYVDEIID